MKRRISIVLSGVGPSSPRHDGKMSCEYVYVFRDVNPVVTVGSTTGVLSGKVDYAVVYGDSSLSATNPIMMNYLADSNYVVSSYEGLFPVVDGGNAYSIFRREYGKYTQGNRDENGVLITQTFVGPWEPVALFNSKSALRDFNVTNNRSYQYLIRTTSGTARQDFANGEASTVNTTGDPVALSWPFWSIAELIPEENAVDAPILRKTYKVNLDNIWLFKYNLDTGSQTQNIAQSEVQTLGEFGRVSIGQLNAVSGSVSCMLGSEIIPCSKSASYVERTWAARSAPTSTNERVAMLMKWRSLMKSKNPKLLKDMKGQIWIVQTSSPSNTPSNYYANQPDKISFSWKQIDKTDNVVIYGDSDAIAAGGANTEWVKVTDYYK